MGEFENFRDLDSIARDAWAGNFTRVMPLSTNERLYVALASGRMQEIAPGNSIAYAVDRIGPEWMQHLIQTWRSGSQPSELAMKSVTNQVLREALAALERGRPQIKGVLVQQDQDAAMESIRSILGAA